MITFTSIEEVVNSLGTDRNEVPRYLNLLNLMWGDEGVTVEIKRLKELALNLLNTPEMIRALIRGGWGWRPTLVGNAVAILIRDTSYNFQEDMIQQIINLSWVSPQLAAGIALLRDEKTEERLTTILDSRTSDSDPKMILSAYSALRFLNSNVAKEFENQTDFGIIKEKDWDNCIEIATEHWEFWKHVDPIITPNH